MAKPRFPGKPHRLLSRNRTRISTFSNPHDDDTLDVIGNVCFGLGVFKHCFPETEEPHLPGHNDFKGFTTREVSASKSYAKRKYEEANKRDFKHSSTSSPLFTPIPLIITPTIEGPKNEKEELDNDVIGVPSSKKARRKGGGRKSVSITPKQTTSKEAELVPEIKQEKPDTSFTPASSVSQEKQETSDTPATGVSLLPSVESPLSWVGHPLIVEGKRRWKPTYKVLQGPSLLEESRRLGGEAWPLGARQMGRAVEAPAPLGGKFVTGSGEKEQESRSTPSNTSARPSGGGILREARLRLDSAATGTEDGEWVRRMMDDTDKSKPSVPDLPKPASQSSAVEGGSPDKSVPESEISRVYCRICKGAMSRRFSKRKMGKRGVWSCKACREFAAEMTKKLRNQKNGEGNNEEPASTTILTCRGGKGKCPEEENWPPAPPQRCVPCWLRLCLNAPPPHLIPCPVSRAALRKQLPVYGAQPPKEPGKRGKKRRGTKFVHYKSKRQKVAAEGPRVKHVCRSALAVLGRPPATFPAREPLKTQGGEASTGQESSTCSEVKEAEGSAKEQEGDDQLLEGNEASSPPMNSSGGAHQWWKQRKGMHRRRKKGRLSLALPRKDGKLALPRHIPKSPPAIKPPLIAKVSKDLGPPLKLEGYPFRADAAEVFTNGYGVIQVAPNIMPVKPVCFLCGSGGKQWLVHCAMCCEPFHTFCVEWAGWDIFDGWDVPSTGPPKIFRPLEWMCRRCSLCHACGLPAYVPGGGMPSVASKKKLKAIEKKAEEDGDKKKKKDDEDEEMEDMGTRTCNLCHRCYHGSCLGSATENQKSNDFALFKDRETPWVCSTCLKCHSCGKQTVAGSVPKRSSERMKEEDQTVPESGPEDLLMCAQCLSLHRKGNFCPLCHVVYRDTDFDALMMQCAQCSSWVHASCEGLTDDQYHLLSLLPSSIEFTCSPCTSSPNPSWRKAVEKKLRQGLERILEILIEAVNARDSSSLPPPLSPGIPTDPSICYSDIPAGSFQSKLQNLPKNVDKGDSSRQEFANGYSCPNDTLDKKSSESNDVDFCNSDKCDINNEDITKVSVVLDKSEKVTSAEASNFLLELKKRVSCGDFSDPSDFSKAVQHYFPDDELVISTLCGALSKAFPSVKPKYFPRELTKKIELLFTDHNYSCTSKTSDLLKRLPKVEDKENDTKNVASDEKNVKLTFSCDLKSNAEGSEKASACALKELGENTSKSKETQKENLWMDPSDYIPNLKVYSFASALRRRSRNKTVLRLSTKDFEQKIEPINTPSENELNMTLENSKSIVTYKSVLAGIKKECSESDISANENTDKCSDDTKLVDESKDIPELKVQEIVHGSTKLETIEEGIAENMPVSKENGQHSSFNDLPNLELEGSLSEIGSSKDDKKVNLCSVPQNVIVNCIGVEEIRSGVDARRCLFCHVRGDADVEREGRLLLASSFGDWVHCNCALWSAEVYEEKGGLLMKVREAVNRGRRVRCALCRETGATLGCCLRGCPDSFHLGCALRSGCLLLEDKSVYCRNHIPADKTKDSNVEMSLKRPVQVDTEGRKGSVLWRWKKPGRTKRKPGENGSTFAAGSLRFTVGSLHVECLGKIVPGNVQGQFIRPPDGKKIDNEGEMRWCEGGVSLAKKEEKESQIPEMMAYGGPVIVPVGFRCTRLYWSSVEPWKVVEYHVQTVLVISETDEAQLAITEEKEEKPNEEHDLHAHVTVDHTAEAEDDSRSGEHSDLIMPSDLNDEILKDLPSDIFTNKKLVQSIVGLLKGANNNDIQNGISLHTFKEGEDGKVQKNLSDKENSISPNGSSLSDLNIQVPRHNKPMNVLQPVSKEALLTTESASRAWELTCEMRAAQTPPPSASPTMAGAAGNTTDITSIIKSQNKQEIWTEGAKDLWKRLRPISQLDGNADPSSSSSEGGGSSPVRSFPSREPDQALPCLLACRIKQQSLARSEPGGGGPVKCNDCRRTYRTREGFERHLCGTPLPLSSTSSDSDSEDRTSRRVSSESDVPNISEDTVPQANDTFEHYNEYSGKEKTSDETLNSKPDDNLTHCLTEYAALNEDCHVEMFSPSSNDPIPATHMGLNTTEPCQSKVVATASFASNLSENSVLMGDESQNAVTNHSPADQPEEMSNHLGEREVIYHYCEDDSSAKNSTKSGTLNSNSSDSVCLQNVAKNTEKKAVGSLVKGTKEAKAVWKGSNTDVCATKSTKRQMAKVQPVCYVNGTRRIQSAGLLEAPKVTRLAISQEETLVCNSQQMNQGGIPQTSIMTAPIQPQGANNFQVLVRQLPSSSAVPQFAENFRQQTGHTLQYLATIDPNSFNQPGQLTQPQNLVGLMQGTPQIMQTQTLVSSQQMIASSPLMLAPQQQAIVYNPVTACIEALPTQQPNYILTPSTYTIPVSTSMSYSMPQEVPQVYFQSTPQPPAPPQPQAPQLEPVIQNEVGWTLPPGYQIVQNQPVEQHPQVIQPQHLPQMIASNVLSVVEEEPQSVPVPQTRTVPIQPAPCTTAKKKRMLLPNNKVREGYMAYRRDERTGKYIPVEEGWEESLGLPVQKKVVIEESGIRSGLPPAVFPVEAKDGSAKDGRKRPIARKGDSVNVLGAESVESQGSPKRWVRAKLTSQFYSPSNSACESGERVSDPSNPNFGLVNRTHSGMEQVSLGTERVPKRVESAAIVYQIRSTDGLTIQSDSPDKMWDQVFNSVQEARVAYGLAPLPRNPFAPIYGSKPFIGAETLALSHKGLRYLLNQLPGASQLLESKLSAPEVPSVAPPPHRLFSRAHLSLSTQTSVEETPSIPPPPSSPPLPENPSGCARTEAYKMPPAFPGGLSSAMSNRKWRHRDIFGWLASPHRKLPMAPLPTQDSEPNGGGNRRATSLDLPMAMRFRHLKETSRETVGVYRSHIHGRGLFCLKDIEAGEMVIEYSGEVIRSSLTDTREKTYEAKGMGCYMFRIDEQTVVDATMRGNAARFINHSCDPNCYSRVVDILGKKHILIFALRRIPRGEELTYDYKFPFEDVKIPCHCASKRCRKYLN